MLSVEAWKMLKYTIFTITQFRREFKKPLKAQQRFFFGFRLAKCY